MAFTTTTGAGGTSLIGTSGVDTLNLGANTYPLYIGAQGADDLITVTTGAISSVDANLGAGGDLFTATEDISGSTIRGNDGDDTINLSGALDSSALINGNAGEDTMSVGGAMSESARVLGGSDNYVITVTSAMTDGAIVNGNDGKDLIEITIGSQDGATVFGGKGSDTLDATGNLNAVILSGDIGADTVTGGAGADTLFGGDGADIITANGDETSDLITDTAVDSLIGGAGADTFQAVGYNGLAANTGDIISDFSVSEDRIRLNEPALFQGSITDGSAPLTGLYAISGTFNSVGVFTPVSVANGGFNTLIAEYFNGRLINDNTKAILNGVLASDVTASNFLI